MFIQWYEGKHSKCRVHGVGVMRFVLVLFACITHMLDDALKALLSSRGDEGYLLQGAKDGCELFIRFYLV
jgi:hypothetical protein